MILTLSMHGPPYFVKVAIISINKIRKSLWPDYKIIAVSKNFEFAASDEESEKVGYG